MQSKTEEGDCSLLNKVVNSCFYLFDFGRE